MKVTIDIKPEVASDLIEYADEPTNLTTEVMNMFRLGYIVMTELSEKQFKKLLLTIETNNGTKKVWEERLKQIESN